MSNYAHHYPPEADALLAMEDEMLRKENQRLLEIEREYRDDPASMAADYPDEHHVRLGRMLRHIADRHAGKTTEAEFWTKMQTEYNACLLTTIHWQAKREGLL